jgi:hypothetical protein
VEPHNARNTPQTKINGWEKPKKKKKKKKNLASHNPSLFFYQRF